MVKIFEGPNSGGAEGNKEIKKNEKDKTPRIYDQFGKVVWEDKPKEKEKPKEEEKVKEVVTFGSRILEEEETLEKSKPTEKNEGEAKKEEIPIIDVYDKYGQKVGRKADGTPNSFTNARIAPEGGKFESVLNESKKNLEQKTDNIKNLEAQLIKNGKEPGKEKENEEIIKKLEKLKQEIKELSSALGSGEVSNKYGNNKAGEERKGYDQYDFTNPHEWAKNEVAKREGRDEPTPPTPPIPPVPPVPPIPVPPIPPIPPVPVPPIPPIPPVPPIQEKKRLNIINIDEIAKSYAWRMAEEKLRELLHKPEEDMQSNSRMKSLFNALSAPFRHPIEFAKKAWVRMAEDRYRQKFFEEAKAEIEKNQTLLFQIQADFRLGKSVQAIDPKAKEQLNYEILNKVLEEYSKGIVEQEERGNKVENPEVNNAFQNLIARHIMEGWDRAKFEQEQRILINSLKERGLINNQDFLGIGSKRSTKEVQEGLMYATNIFEVAEDYKKHIDKKIEEICKEKNLTPEQKKMVEEHVRSTLKLDISLGAKFSDIHNKRPEGTLGWADKFVSGLQRVPILGRIASNPGSAALVFGVAGTMLGRTASRVMLGAGLGAAGLVTGAWIPIAGASLSAGLYTAIRKRGERKKDRAMHQREKALGKEYGDSNYRREEMESFQYDIKSTTELQNQLENIKKTGEFGKLPREQKLELASVLARFKTELLRAKEYREGGKNRTVDLISAADREEGEKYGTSFISKTKLKDSLYEYLRENNLIGGDNHALLQNEEFNKLFYLESQRLYQNIEEQDKKYESDIKKKMIRWGVAAGTVAGVFGTGLQQFGGWYSQRAGGGSKYTAWDSLKDFFHSNKKIDETVLVDAGIISRKEHFSNFDDYAKAIGMNNNQRVSYGVFDYQGSAPDKGTRALPEVFENIRNNAKLNANLTEKALSYKLGANGEVLVDYSKIVGKPLKGPLGEAGREIQKAIAEGRAYFLLSADNNPSPDGSQFHPIMQKLLPNSEKQLRIPDNLKAFFGFDESGHLLKGAGAHPGLHTLVIDTGGRRADGTMIVESIASTMGKKPDLSAMVDFMQKVPAPKQFDIPWTLAASGVPRWQLEGERKKEELSKSTDLKKIYAKAGLSTAEVKLLEDAENPYNYMGMSDEEKTKFYELQSKVQLAKESIAEEENKKKKSQETKLAEKEKAKDKKRIDKINKEREKEAKKEARAEKKRIAKLNKEMEKNRAKIVPPHVIGAAAQKASAEGAAAEQ
jgi:hypothetical protein